MLILFRGLKKVRFEDDARFWQKIRSPEWKEEDFLPNACRHDLEAPSTEITFALRINQ